MTSAVFIMLASDDCSGRAIEAAGNVWGRRRDVVVIDAGREIGRCADMTAAAIEVHRRNPAVVLRSINRKSVEEDTDEHRLAFCRQPQWLDVIVVFVLRRRMSVVAVK